jgi:O-antigen/teichoic acid export membrane protein
MDTGKSLLTKLIRNTKFNILGYLWLSLVHLLLTPYIIHRIGMDRFGIWAIMGVITGYFGLLDLGFGTPFVKYIAEFYAKKEYEKISQVINAGIVFYSLLSIFSITLVYFFIDPLITFLKIPAHLYVEAKIVFIVSMIIFCVSSALKALEAIQGGLQRMDISNKIAIAVSLPNILGTIFFLERGYGLLGLVINNAIVLGITNIINIIIAFKILPGLKLNFMLFNKKIFKMLFGFGIKRWVTTIEEIVLLQTDKLLISHFLTLGLVGYYQLGFLLVSKVGHLPMLLISAIIPAASELDAGQRREDTIKLYLKGTKYLLSLSAPIFIFLFSTSHLIMFAWMGQGYQTSAIVIQLMAASFLIMSLPAMGSAIAVGIGKPEFQMEAGGGQAILNLILSIILIIKIGFFGVLIATLISVILSTAYFIKRLHKYLNLSIVYFIKKTMIGYLLVTFIIGIIIYLVNSKLNYLTFSRLSSLTLLILEAVLFFFGYAVLLSKINFLDKEDIQLAKNILSQKLFQLKIFCY